MACAKGTGHRETAAQETAPEQAAPEQTASSTSSADSPVRPGAPTRPGWVLTVMCAGMFLVLLDVTVVNVALPSISSGLGAESSAVAWVVDAYAVAIASLLLGGGTVGDRVGHRRVVLAGLAVFGVASIGCALAPTPTVLIAARAVQGVGAALLLPGSVAVITEAYPGRTGQARALGIWAGVSSLALPAGPLLGGALVTLGGWRLVFWINLPVLALALTAIPVLVPTGRRHRDRTLDASGLVTAAVTLAALVFAAIDLGHHGARPVGLVAFTVAVLTGGALVVRERRAPAPMLPPELLRRRSFAGPNVAALLMNLVVNGTLFVTTLYLQSVQHRSALIAGIALLPLFVPVAALAPVTGRVTARYGPRPPMLAGAAVAALGSAAVLLVAPTSAYGALVPALAGLGIGAGLFTASVVAAAVRAVPPERSGLASGVNNTARQTGTALGVAVFGAVAAAPGDPVGFVTGLHRLALLGAALWAAALLITLRTVARSTGSGPD